MAGFAVADLLVGWVRGVAARVARFDREHAVHAQKYRLEAPETSAAEGGRFDCLTHAELSCDGAPALRRAGFARRAWRHAAPGNPAREWVYSLSRAAFR
ncbi:MAG: hypothetical protein PW999_20620 [Paraburkholderia tropica]|nr:hypothetical protein [Paraburkholderia tropica]